MMKQKIAFNNFGKQVEYVILTNIITLIIGIVQIPFVTKALGPTQYGTWALISTTISLIVPFSMLSFSMSIIRFLAVEKDPDRIRDDFFSACSLVLAIGVFFSTLFFLFSDLISVSIFKNADATYYIKLSSILILFNSMFPVLLSFFRRGSKVGIYNALNLCLNILQFSLLILFLLRGYRITGVILAAIISTLMLNIIAFFIILKQIGFQRPKFKNMKAYLKWGIPLTPNNAILWIIQASDRFVISYFLGISAAGIYNAAYSIGYYASFALWPVGIVLYPIISKAYDEGNLRECEKYIKYSFKYLMMITIPSAVGLSILSNPLLKILTTPEFISGRSVTPFIAFGAALFCVYQIGIYIIHMVGKTHINIRILSIGAFLNLILNIILVPRIGIIGAGLASLLAYGGMGILTLWITRRYMKFDLSLTFILKSLLSSVSMALIIWLIKPGSLATMIISIIIGIIIYFVILVLIRGFTKEEIQLFKSFLRNTA